MQITISDLRKLYTSKHLDPDHSPASLQNKVQWDLRFYFARCANENIDQFTKGTFQINTHQGTGLKFITKVMDEQTKNHQVDQSDLITACMIETPGSKMCPIKSFMKYVDHLSQLIPDLWQYAKDGIDVMELKVWYTNKKIGTNPLATFMSTLSENCELSKVYTNHCIRVTGTTFLMRNKFSAKQVMAITGHKSLNSLSIYQKVSTDEKLAMAFSMQYYLQVDNPYQAPHQQINEPIALKAVNQLSPKVTSENAITPSTSKATGYNMNELVEYESENPLADIPEFDLQNIIDTIEQESMTTTQTDHSTTTVAQKTTYKRSPQIPIFQNCKIGNINIHIHKN